jgi:hypothetical protein
MHATRNASDTPLVALEELPARMAALPLWTLLPERNAISRAFTARNFAAGARCARARAARLPLTRALPRVRSDGVSQRRSRSG